MTTAVHERTWHLLRLLLALIVGLAIVASG